MMTPRPDYFTYPTDRPRGIQLLLTKRWTRALVLGGLVGGFVLALALAAAAIV